MSRKHEHTSADVALGTVTLCAVNSAGDRWAHVPVDRLLWAQEELHDGFRERVRREAGDDSAAVEVVGA